MKLEPKHWAVIAGLITGLATQLLSAQHGWTDITTPGFVAGLLIQVASAISAIFVGAPGASAALDQANRNTDMANESVRAALDPPPDPAKLDPKRFIGTGAVLLACLLGVFSTACAPKQFHTAVVANSSLAQAIWSVQDAEIVAHNAGLIDAEHHAKYKQQILLLLNAGDDLTLALKDWNPSLPVPANVGLAIGNVQRLLSDLRVDSPNVDRLIAAAETVLSVLRGTGVLPGGATAKARTWAAVAVVWSKTRAAALADGDLLAFHVLTRRTDGLVQFLEPRADVAHIVRGDAFRLAHAFRLVSLRSQARDQFLVGNRDVDVDRVDGFHAPILLPEVARG